LFLSANICVLLSVVISGFAQEKMNLAVAEFEARNVSAMDAAAISDFVRTELVKTGSFNILERRNMEHLLSEQKFQMTGCTTEECAVKMGRLLNCQKIIIGTLTNLGGIWHITASVVDVETGKITVSERVQTDSVANLGDKSEEIARILAKRIIKPETVPLPEEELGVPVPPPTPVVPVPPAEEEKVEPSVKPKTITRGRRGNFSYTYQRLTNTEEIFTDFKDIKQTVFTLYLRIPLSRRIGLLLYDTYHSFTFFYEYSYYGGMIKEEYAFAQNFLQAMLYYKIFEGTTLEGDTKFDWLFALGTVQLNGAWANSSSSDKYTDSNATAYTEMRIPLSKKVALRIFISGITATVYREKIDYSFYGIDFLVSPSSNWSLGFGYQINLAKPEKDASGYKDWKFLNLSLRMK